MTAAHELDLLELRRRKRLNLINNNTAVPQNNAHPSAAAPAFRELPKPVAANPRHSTLPYAPPTAELHSNYHAPQPQQTTSTTLPTLPSISTMLASLNDPLPQRTQPQSRPFPAADSLFQHSLASVREPLPAALPPHTFNMNSSRDLIAPQQPYCPTTSNDLMARPKYSGNGPNPNPGFQRNQHDYYPQNELPSPRESQWKMPNPYADQRAELQQYQQPQPYPAHQPLGTEPYYPTQKQRPETSYPESKLPPPEDFSLAAVPPAAAPFATAMTPSQIAQYQHIQQHSPFNTLPMNPAFTSKQRRPIRSMLIVFEIATTAAGSSQSHPNPAAITTSSITPIVISTSPIALTNTFRPLEELAAPYIFMFGESNKGSENATHRCRSQIDRLNKFYMSLASASRCSNSRCQITTAHLFCKVHRPGGRAITFWAPRADFRAALAPQGGSSGVVDEEDDKGAEERWNDDVPTGSENNNKDAEKRKRRRSPEPASNVVGPPPPPPPQPLQQQHGSAYAVDATMIPDVELVMAEATVRARREALERAERAVAMERERVERDEGELMRRKAIGEVL
ncbi:hypothetical protein BJ742DRAFT_147102 [Cladochytrium replicatum]|nr:hypothetical protein BJ742DRAFT_147102 [Cladochytrium replicatum]